MDMSGRWLLGAMGVLGLGYGAIMAAMVALEPKLVFPAPDLDTAWLDREAARNDAQPLSLETSDGETLYGWWIPAEGPKAVVFFSGNATSVGLDLPTYSRWRAEGVSVLHVNYRGYPGSSGSPSEQGLRSDARTAWQWLRKRYDAEDIVVAGRSLGGGVAIALAAEFQPRGLALLATYSSAVQVARDSYPWLPVGLLMRNRFDSVSVAPSVRCPTVIVHGDKDAMIGPHHPTALAAAFPTPPTLIWVRGRSHNDPLLTDAKAWEAVRALAR